jgi:hypothetical protein
MGKDADVTMTNLKSATGIADDRLSAHHPNGTGNTTSMGDFLTNHIGRRVASPEWEQGMTTDINGDPYGSNGFDTRLSIPDITVHSEPGAPVGEGSLDTDGNFEFDTDVVLGNGNRFWVRVGTGIDPNNDATIGDLFGDAIAVTDSLDVSGNNCEPTGDRKVGTDGDGKLVIDIEMEITGFNNAAVYITFQDGLNVDATNYGNSMQFFTTDVQKDTVYMDQITVQWSNLGGESSQLFVDCQLNSLDAGNTKGDSTFTMRVSPVYNNPAGRTTYTYLYFEVIESDLSCPGSGNAIAQGGGSCFDFQITPDLESFLRVVVTEGQNGQVLDQRDIQLNFNTVEANADSYSNSYSNKGPITC